MKIALGLGLNSSSPRGVDAYYASLCAGFASLKPPHDFRIFSYFWKDFASKRARLPTVCVDHEHVEARRWPSSVVDGLESRGFHFVDRFYVRPGHFGLYHGLGSALPRITSCPTVVTIHDLFYERAREEAQLRCMDPLVVNVNRYFPATPAIRSAAARATRIIATSTQTKEDLVRLYGTDPEKIDVVLYGFEDRIFQSFGKDNAYSLLPLNFGLTRPFVLLPGPFEPRRNYERCLHAMKVLKDLHRLSPLVVFCGDRNEYLHTIIMNATQMGLEVQSLGYVAKSDLVHLYEAADAVLHPLLHGTSQVVYEALACGSALMVSDTPENLEIVGDAAAIVKPNDTRDIVEALQCLLSKEGSDLYRYRATSRVRGDRSVNFESLKATAMARRYLEIYDRVFSQSTVAVRPVSRDVLGSHPII